MTQIIFIVAFVFIIQIRALQYALNVAKNKRVISSHRFILSMIIICVPILGIILYHVLKNSLKEKEFIYFSEEFIDRILDSRK